MRQDSGCRLARSRRLKQVRRSGAGDSLAGSTFGLDQKPAHREAMVVHGKNQMGEPVATIVEIEMTFRSDKPFLLPDSNRVIYPAGLRRKRNIEQPVTGVAPPCAARRIS
jgi:hypothetical protein